MMAVKMTKARKAHRVELITMEIIKANGGEMIKILLKIFY